MRFVAAAAALAIGCFGGNEVPDAGQNPGPGPGPGPGSGPSCQYPKYLCNTTQYKQACGNNAIDSCYYQPMPNHCTFYPGGSEACDGTSRPTCVEAGFYGGETACTDCTSVDVSGCTACAPTVTTCVERPGPKASRDIAVSGTHIAVPGDGKIAIFDGASFVSETTLAGSSSVTATPQGFLVATTTPPTVRTLDTAGVLGAPTVLPSDAQFPVVVYGAGGTALVAWSAPVNGVYYVFRAIVDTSGAIVVPASALFPGDQTLVDAGTDGTAFFVGQAKTLARVLPDGTATVVGGFPVGAPRITWDGTTGWYVAHDTANAVFQIQAFTATGAKTGTPASHTAIKDTVAGTNELLLLTNTGTTLSLSRMSATMPLTTVSEIGRGNNAAWLARIGSQVVVVWNASSLRLAFVPAP